MTLSETWFVEGTIDFELQKYRLLAYLKEVNEYFSESKLYPKLSDVIFHYNNLIAFRDNKRFLQEQFPKRMDALHLEKLEIIYERMLADDELMEELESITQYGVGKLKRIIENGTAIYDFVEQQLMIEPVGILPLYKNEGYLLLRYGAHAETRAYTYTITLFEHQAARFKGVKMQYLNSWPRSIMHTFEHIKKEIIRQQPVLHNPAVYRLETGLQLPLDETILPVAKRMFVKYLSGGFAE